MTTFAEALVLVLYVGAARADANPQQRKQLAATVPAAGRDRYLRTGDDTEIRAAVRKAMGGDWRPTGVWAAQIEALGGDVDG